MGILDLLFDRRCKICGQKISKGAVCESCDAEINKSLNIQKRNFKLSTKDIEGVYLFDYDNETVKKLIFTLKRTYNKELFEYVSYLYEKSVGSDFKGCVTYVPRRNVNTRYYGFDHVREPVKIICKRNSELEFCSLLKRRGRSKNQKDLDSAQRKINVENAFKIKKDDIHTNIVLVDDVVTTGSTVCACAEEILKVNESVNMRFAFLVSRNISSRERKLENKF